MGGNLAWSVATGTPWLGHDVIRGRVAIIDNELHPETLRHRLYRIATELMIDIDDHRDAIDVYPIRGRGLDIHGIRHAIRDIEPGTYDLVILDALYRTIPEGTSENDNAAMMAIYNRLDDYASKWDCAIAVVHHASKGGQGEKSITDVGAGAGSISRAADTHIIVRPHEDDGLSVMECVTRSFKSPDPVSIKFDWPIWSTVGAEPEVRKPGRREATEQAKQDKEASAAILREIPMAPKGIQQKLLFERFDFGVGKATRLVGALVREKAVKITRRRKKGGKQTFVFYSRLDVAEENDSGNDSDSDISGIEIACPSSPMLKVATRVTSV